MPPSLLPFVSLPLSHSAIEAMQKAQDEVQKAHEELTKAQQSASAEQRMRQRVEEEMNTLRERSGMRERVQEKALQLAGELVARVGDLSELVRVASCDTAFMYKQEAAREQVREGERARGRAKELEREEEISKLQQKVAGFAVERARWQERDEAKTAELERERAKRDQECERDTEKSRLERSLLSGAHLSRHVCCRPSPLPQCQCPSLTRGCCLQRPRHR